MTICICPKCGYRNDCEELACVVCDTPLRSVVCDIRPRGSGNPHSVDSYCSGCKFWGSSCRIGKRPTSKRGALFCIWRRDGGA